MSDGLGFRTVPPLLRSGLATGGRVPVGGTPTLRDESDSPRKRKPFRTVEVSVEAHSDPERRRVGTTPARVVGWGRVGGVGNVEKSRLPSKGNRCTESSPVGPLGGSRTGRVHLGSRCLPTVGPTVAQTEEGVPSPSRPARLGTRPPSSSSGWGGTRVEERTPDLQPVLAFGGNGVRSAKLIKDLERFGETIRLRGSPGRLYCVCDSRSSRCRWEGRAVVRVSSRRPDRCQV